MSPIKLFEQKKVRSHYDTEKEIWYFSVIDVIQILTGSTIPKRYWTDLKKKLKLEGSEAYDKIVEFAYSSKFLLKM
jgi:DNA-damage-inducible protein D